jgi:hypothetical protein
LFFADLHTTNGILAHTNVTWFTKPA